MSYLPYFTDVHERTAFIIVFKSEIELVVTAGFDFKRECPSCVQDKDVARLQDFQELEVVLEKAEGLSLFSGAGGLTDRPCYNMKASRLTY